MGVDGIRRLGEPSVIRYDHARSSRSTAVTDHGRGKPGEERKEHSVNKEKAILRSASHGSLQMIPICDMVGNLQ
jgi:hypothetical protein